VAFPDTTTGWGLLDALSEIVSVPDCAPAAVGVKVTEIEQLIPGESAAGQVFVWANPTGAAILEMFKIVLPVLDRLNVCAALELPMF